MSFFLFNLVTPAGGGAAAALPAMPPAACAATTRRSTTARTGSGCRGADRAVDRRRRDRRHGFRGVDRLLRPGIEFALNILNPETTPNAGTYVYDEASQAYWRLAGLWVEQAQTPPYPQPGQYTPPTNLPYLPWNQTVFPQQPVPYLVNDWAGKPFSVTLQPEAVAILDNSQPDTPIGAGTTATSALEVLVLDGTFSTDDLDV